jgi:hypothetical protein
MRSPRDYASTVILMLLASTRTFTAITNALVEIINIWLARAPDFEAFRDHGRASYVSQATAACS